MDSSFYTILSEQHTECCACWQNINWNISKFLECGDNNGFIVQKYSRELVASSNFDILEYQPISYYEAWKIVDGKIDSADSGDGCDDTYCIGNQLAYFDQFRLSFETQGHFIFNGTVFWISQTHPLYEIVDSWPRDIVQQTRKLRAVYKCQRLEHCTPVDIRKPFIHYWDLTNEEKIYNAAKSALFQFSKNNTSADREYLDRGIQDIFDGKYKEIAIRIKKEWEMQWGASI